MHSRYFHSTMTWSGVQRIEKCGDKLKDNLKHAPVSITLFESNVLHRMFYKYHPRHGFLMDFRL